MDLLCGWQHFLSSDQPAASITASLDTLKLDVDNQDLDSFLSDNDEVSFEGARMVRKIDS